MASSLLFNLVLALIGFFLVFALSLATNTIETSMIRGLLSFAFFFILAFGIRSIYRYILSDPREMNQEVTSGEERETTPINSANSNLEQPRAVQKENPNLPDESIKKTSDYIKDLLKEDE